MRVCHPRRRICEGVSEKDIGKITETEKFVPSSPFSAWCMFAGGTYEGEDVLVAKHTVSDRLHCYKVIAPRTVECDGSEDDDVVVVGIDRVFTITPAENMQLVITDPIVVQLLENNMLKVSFV
jgi:hypothetical protein